MSKMLFLLVTALLVPAITSSPITVAEILEDVFKKPSSQFLPHHITSEELHKLPTHSLLEFAEKLKSHPAYDDLEFKDKLQFKEPYSYPNVILEQQNPHPRAIITSDVIVAEQYAPVHQYTTSNVVLEEQYRPISPSHVIVEEEIVHQWPNSASKIIVQDENYAPIRPQYTTSNVNEQYVPTRPFSASNIKVEDQIIRQIPDIVIEEVYTPPPGPTKVILLEEVYTSSPPEYSASKILIEDLYKYIQKKFDFIIPTPEQTSFVAVKLVVNILGEGLARGLDYDSAYTTAKQIVKLGQLYPETARDLLAQIENKQLNIQAAPIRNLINDVCGPVIENPEWCDQQIDIRVRSNPSYEATAKFLLRLGEMAKLFDAWIPEAELVSAQHIEEEYLARSKCSLKPLIFALGEVYRASNRMP